MADTRIFLCALLAFLCSQSSYAGSADETSTWEQTRDIALEKARARDFDYIIEHLLAPENPDFSLSMMFISTIVMGMIYGLLIEVITSVLFKAKA